MTTVSLSINIIRQKNLIQPLDIVHFFLLSYPFYYQNEFLKTDTELFCANFSLNATFKARIKTEAFFINI